MSATSERTERIRVQLDMTPAEVGLMEVLQHRLAVRSRADMLQQAFGTFLWVVGELLSGRRVVSVEADLVGDIARFRELNVPSVAPSQFEHFDYLVARPHPGRKQPYLKGRNMTVGQLVYKMRANDLDIEGAAEDMDLPVSQIREAVAYYELHRDLVDGEIAEEARWVREQGLTVDPPAVP